jgi:hypothetical protein
MIDKIVPRKLDTSVDLKLTPKDSMIDALNVSITDSYSSGAEGAGDIGVLKNIPGNTATFPYNSFDAIFGDSNYQVIGSVADLKSKIIYFFVWSNEVARQGIYAYDPQGRLPKNSTTPEGKKNSFRLILNSSQFRFPQNGFVKADVVHVKRSEFSKYPAIKSHMIANNYWEDMSADAIIYFTDNKSEPKKVNVYRALLDNASQSNLDNIYGYLNYTESEINDFISACPRTPLEKIKFNFGYDSSFDGSNFVGGSCFTFAYQFVYKDGIESSISPYSDLAVPTQTLTQGSSSFVDYTTTNVCVLTIPAANREVQFVRILLRRYDTSSWFLVDELPPTQLTSGNSYTFYNNKILTAISDETVAKQFDSVPRSAYTQTVSNNRLLYGNYTEGFDNVSVSATITPIVSETPQQTDVRIYITPSLRSNGKWTDELSQAQKFDRNKIYNGGASFILDVDATDISLPTGSVLKFNLKISPDKNFHIYRKNGWSMPSADSNTAARYFEEDSLAQPYPVSYDKVDSYATEDADNTTPNCIIQGTWTSYSETGNQQTQQAYIGRDVTKPLILPGGQLAFYIEFKYTGTTLFGSDAAEKISSTLSKILCDGAVADTSIEILSNQNTFVHEWNLGLNNFAKISSFGPRYWIQNIDNNEVDQALLAENHPNSDYRSWLITPVFNSIFNSSLPQGPIGYVIANSGKTKFGFEYVSEENDGAINEILLNIKSIDEIGFMSCIRRPVTDSNWVVLTNDFLFGPGTPVEKQTQFLENLDLEQIDTLTKYYGLQQNNVAQTLVLNTAGGSLSGYENYKKQFGGISSAETLLDGGNSFSALTPNPNKVGICVIDGEGGIGGRPLWSKRANAYNLNNGGSILCWTYLYLGAQEIKIDGYFFNGRDAVVGLRYFVDADEPYADVNESFSYFPTLYIGSEPQEIVCDFSNIPLRKRIQEGVNQGTPYSTIPEANQTALQAKVEVTNKIIDVVIPGELDSYRSFKSSSYHEFGVVYYDERGRHGFVNPLPPVYAPGYSDLDRGASGGGKGKIDFKIVITSQHPSWAKYYRIVHSRSTSVQRFVQYTAGGAFIRHTPPQNEPNSDNIYVSLNYLQNSVLSYSRSFGARSPEGGLDLYKFTPGDRVRIINYEENAGLRTYPHNYDFEVVDLVDLGDEKNPLHEGSNDVPYNKTGHFLVLKNNPSAIYFDYSSVKAGTDRWYQNCIIEVYTPSKTTDDSGKIFYEVSDRLFASGISQPVSVRNGDVWWRPIAMNIRQENNGIWPDILIDTPATASENTSRPNFRSRYVESMTFTDLYKGDVYGLGRPNVIVKEAQEVRNESGIVYSQPTPQSASRLRYSDFNSSLLNFKDTPEIYGGITYLVDRGDSILSIQESKCCLIPTSRNILSDVSGNELITSSMSVLGTERYFAGQVGCDKTPESVVDVDGVVYFVNKSLGKVFAVDNSSSEEVSAIGMETSFRTLFSSYQNGVRVPGGYDPINKEYIFTVNSLDDTQDVYEPPPPAISGCTDPNSCNYNPSATVPDGSCVYPALYRDCLGQCVNDSDGDGVCDEEEVNGCTDPTAPNFNPLATNSDPNSCFYYGCMDPSSCNYNALANINDGSCSYPPNYRNCDGGCAEYHVIYADTEGQQEFSTGVCKDVALELYCGDPSSCNYYEVFYPDDESVETYHYYVAYPVYDVNGNLLFGGCEYGSCAGVNNYVIETLDDYISILGLNFNDIVALSVYANTNDLFDIGAAFDANNDGNIGSPDLLVFLSSYDAIVYGDTSVELMSGEYNAASIIIPGDYDSIDDFLSQGGYDGIYFAPDSNYSFLPSSSDYDTNGSENSALNYKSAKLLHIIANTDITKQQLKDKLEPIITAASGLGYLSRLVLSNIIAAQDISIVSVGSSTLLSFLSSYGLTVQENNTDYNELVFN